MVSAESADFYQCFLMQPRKTNVIHPLVNYSLVLAFKTQHMFMLQHNFFCGVERKLIPYRRIFDRSSIEENFGQDKMNTSFQEH